MMRMKKGVAWLTMGALCFAVLTLGGDPVHAQGAGGSRQSQRVVAELTDNWGNDARLTLHELAELPSRSDGPDAALPDMSTYLDALARLQNLRTHAEVAIRRLRDAPPAASIGPKSTRDIARSLEKVKESLNEPIIELYEADTPEEADRAVQSAIIAIRMGMQTVPQL